MAKEKEAKEDAEAPAGKKKLMIIIIPVVLLLAVAGWFFFLKSDDSGVPEELPEPVPGAAVKLDSITINLAGAHFLKFGMALQLTATAHEVDGLKALDLAIGQFSQMTIDELSTSEGRNKAKEELIARIKLTYVPEGTDLAVATSVEDKSDSEANAESEEINIGKLSAAEAIERAESLTVQSEVYDLYFTEFVMQ